MEHGQGPQIPRMMPHAPGHDIGQRIQGRATMMVDNPLWVAGGARCVVQADCVPFIARKNEIVILSTLGQQLFVSQRADTRSAVKGRILDINHQHIIAAGHLDGGADDFGKLWIDQNRLGFCMVENERYGLCIEAGVHSIQHSTAHGDAEMCFEHFRDVGGNDRNGIVLADSARGQTATQALHPCVGFAPRKPKVVVDHRDIFRINCRRPLHKAERRKRFEIR